MTRVYFGPGFIFLFIVFFVFSSCKKLDEYFREPETESVKDAIKTSVLIGYAAEIAMSSLAGNIQQNVGIIRSGSSYPCIAVIFIYPDNDYPVPYSGNSNEAITIIGMWPDESTAIITILLSDLNIRTSTFTLHNIHTVPVIKSDTAILVAFAGMDINLAPENMDELLNVNFSSSEIDIELGRLNISQPDNLDVAVEQNAWLIAVDPNDTYGYPMDDTYNITGGGQLVEATHSSAGTFQQAMLGVLIDRDCLRNPLNGLTLIQKVAVEDEKFPETGTAILSFKNSCSGKAYVEIATGIYVTSIGRNISFEMQ